MTTVKEISSINDTKNNLFLSLCNGILSKLNYRKILSVNDLTELRKKDKSAILALLDKCHHIIFNIGSPNSIESFLKRVATKKKKQTQPNDGEGFQTGKFLGICHFRWDWKGYELTEPELLALKSYLSLIDNSINPHFFFVYKNISVSAGIKEMGVKWQADDNYLHNKYAVRVINTDTFASIKFDFYDSASNYTKGVKILDSQALKDALEAFLSDAMAGDMEYTDFCGEFGYEQDSRRAKKIHKACIKSKEKAAKISNDFYELYNQLNEL